MTKETYVEVEARWINLDEKKILKKLEEINATKINDFFFREWVFQHEHWKDKNRRIRVRTDGKTTWMTYKANATWAIDSTEEVELTVSSADDAVKLLKASDLPQVRYQQKKRTKYQFGEIIFDVDN